MIHKVSMDQIGFQIELDIVLGRARDLENSFPSKFLKIQEVRLVTQW